jgi:hypothetical protein
MSTTEAPRDARGPSQQSDILAVNRGQTISEDDPFTLDRYRQFAKHLSKRAVDILDVGCNTGRGGPYLNLPCLHPAWLAWNVCRNE